MRGGRGHGRGRHRVRRGDVRSAILALLDDRPMHGYEMITELEERTGGRWRPSAGSIYPTLQLLEDEGLVTAEEVDGRKVFSLTDVRQEGRPGAHRGPAALGGGRRGLAPLRGSARSSSGPIGAAKQLARADDDEQMTKAAEILKDARRKLYGILAEE